jgi:chromosome segregation protein
MCETHTKTCRQDWLNERKQLQQQLVDAKQTAASSQPRLDISQLQTTIDELRRSLQREEAEKEELQLQLATHSNRVDTYDPAANPICIQNEFASENVELRAKLDELRRDFEGLTDRYRICSEQLADHRDQYSEKETQLRTAEAELQALKERDRNESSSEEKSKAEMIQLEKEVTTLKTERDEMREVLTVCQRDKSQLETDLRKAQDRLREMQNELEEVEVERDGLRTALLTLERDGDSLRQQLDALTDNKEVLTEEKLKLQARLEEERANLKRSYEG